jgi:hypothetical protein
MGGTTAQLPIGRQVSLPGHFDLPVTLESARPLGKGFECRVRLHDGTLDEAVISEQEAAALAGSASAPENKTPLANADQLRLLIESARIRLAYAHDRQFAVSLSGIRTLPHQIEAAFINMLPLAEPVEFIQPDTCFAITVNIVGDEPADFTLYEDDGFTSAYVKGDRNQIRLHADGDRHSTLRSGNYHGPDRFKITGWKHL